MNNTDDTLYPIGDVANRTGLAVSAIRFYSDEGIVPATDVTPAGHRMYGVEAIARLEFIRTLRELGTSLDQIRSEEHTSELQSRPHLVCRLLLEKKKKKKQDKNKQVNN